MQFSLRVKVGKEAGRRAGGMPGHTRLVAVNSAEITGFLLYATPTFKRV
jgi:hypothetical protein